MARVVFYEKPGCINNTRQKQLLRAAGHEVCERSILDHPWTAQELRLFFADKPVVAWFNRAAPRVKSGEVTPERYDEAGALAAMLEDHLLIKRPLMESDGVRVCGFDPEQVERWLGLQPREGREAEAAEIRSHDLQHCPRMAQDAMCPPPAPGLPGASM